MADQLLLPAPKKKWPKGEIVENEAPPTPKIKFNEDGTTFIPAGTTTDEIIAEVLGDFVNDWEADLVRGLYGAPFIGTFRMKFGGWTKEK